MRPFSQTGKTPMPSSFISAAAALTVVRGVTVVTGVRMIDFTSILSSLLSCRFAVFAATVRAIHPKR